MEDLADLIGPIIAGIVLTALAMGWSALRKYVRGTPNRWDDAIVRAIDVVVGPALRKYAASQAPKKPDE